MITDSRGWVQPEGQPSRWVREKGEVRTETRGGFAQAEVKRLRQCGEEQEEAGMGGGGSQVSSPGRRPSRCGSMKALGTIRRLDLGTNACFVQSGHITYKVLKMVITL